MITLHSYNARQLTEWVNDPSFMQLAVLPISKHRALSQAANPRAKAEDVLLVVAKEGEAVRGYMGVLPDEVMVNGKLHHCGWLTCFYVAPETRGTGLGSMIVKEVIRLWQERLFATDFAPGVDAIYHKTGAFDPALKREGIRIYVCSDLHHILPPKRRLFQKLKGLLWVADAVVNGPVRLRLMLSRLPAGNREWLSHWTAEAEAFVQSLHTGKDGFHRAGAEINWILSQPWLQPPPAQDEYAGRYYFSAYSASFSQRLLCIRNEGGAIAALLLLTQRERTLKTALTWIPAESVEAAGRALAQIMIEEGHATLVTLHPGLMKWFSKGGLPALNRKHFSRDVLVTTRLREELGTPDLYFHDGEGDVVFT